MMYGRPPIGSIPIAPAGVGVAHTARRHESRKSDFAYALRTIQGWFQSGVLKGGLWLPDWAYLGQSLQTWTPVTTTGQVVGLWKNAAPVHAYSGNLIVNGDNEAESFDANLLRVTKELSSTKAHSGEKSSKIICTASVGGHYTYSNVLEVGSEYFYSVWVYLPSGQLTTELSFNEASVTVSTETGVWATSETDKWINLWGTFVAQSVSIGVRNNVSSCDGEYWFIDDFYVIKISSGHATQTTTANKPLTAITPITSKPWLTADSTDVLPVVFPSALSVPYTAAMGRRNLLTYSEDFTNSAWTKDGTTAISSTLILEAATTANHRIYQALSISIGTVYTFAATIKAAGRGFALLSNGQNIAISINLTTGEALSVLGSPGNIASTIDSNGYVTASFSGAAASNAIGIWSSVDGVWGNRSFAGDVTKGIEVAQSSVNLGATWLGYEKITHGNTPCTIARVTPTGVIFSEDENLSSATWNNLILPYQYNSAVLVADRQLTARQKAVISRALSWYVPAIGVELLSGGTFASSSGWTMEAGWSIANGVAVCEAAGTVSVSRPVQVQSGRLYRVKLSVLENNGTGNNSLYLGRTNLFSQTHLLPGDYTFYTSLVSGTANIYIYGRAGERFVIDNVSVCEIV